MLKNSLILLVALFALSTAGAQELSKKKNRLTDSVTEVYNVLKDNKNIRQGLYQAIYQKNTAVASGMYDKNQRVGVWRFFNEKGHIMQTYNYTTKALSYEAPEDTTSSLRYFVDKELKPTDKVTKPLKIGGRYYGFIPYLKLFTLPNYIGQINKDIVDATVELLVSPGGRLADYKVHLSMRGAEFRVINMNINLPNPDDMVFTPSTLNGDPIACRIMIKAYITDDNHLDFN